MANQRCDFTIGDTIAGKYRVIRCLGEGSFGKVYQVSDNSGGKYAMKILKMWEIPQNLQDKILARFDMEYETGRIDSPYLVHSYDHGMISGNPFILMETCHICLHPLTGIELRMKSFMVWQPCIAMERCIET